MADTTLELLFPNVEIFFWWWIGVACSFTSYFFELTKNVVGRHFGHNVNPHSAYLFKLLFPRRNWTDFHYSDHHAARAGRLVLVCCDCTNIRNGGLFQGFFTHDSAQSLSLCRQDYTMVDLCDRAILSLMETEVLQPASASRYWHNCPSGPRQP